MRRYRSLAILGLAALSLSTAAAEQRVDQAKDLVKQGEYAARAGDCVACHTTPGGRPFAGGLAMQTPIGTLYSTNITPDKATGIGTYSFADFDQAVRHGIARSGATLYPAMPYPSYAKVSDEDMQALYAFFMEGVEPVAQPNRESDIPWPLSMRWPLAIWRHLFAPTVAVANPGATADPVVARGAYLVEGLGHCGTCHTPRNLFLQEKALSARDGDAFLSGGAPLEGWFAKNLRGDHLDGLGSWSEAELARFFKAGRTDRAGVFGAMSAVVEHSLQHLTDSDRLAIARYLKTLPPRNAQDRPLQDDGSTYQALHNGDVSKAGARLYADNCMACHRSDGKGYQEVFPALAANSAVNTEDPTSLINIVLGGNKLPATQVAITPFTMPPFGWRLSNAEVASVLSFIRSSWGNRGPVVTAEDVMKVRGILPPERMAPAVEDPAKPGTISPAYR
jgi:mono/diheme cytochrome c family protein